jgi:hypothetical protein
MKIIPSILLALSLTAISGIAQEKLTSDQSNSIHTYTPTQYMKEVAADPHDGDIVRLKFNGRAATLSNGPDGTRTGYLESREATTYYYQTSPQIEVQIPKEGLPWFQHVNVFSYASFDRLAVKSYVVYGKIKVDRSGKASVRLIGTEIKHDLDGDTINWGEGPSSSTPSSTP